MNEAHSLLQPGCSGSPDRARASSEKAMVRSFPVGLMAARQRAMAPEAEREEAGRSDLCPGGHTRN